MTDRWENVEKCLRELVAATTSLRKLSSPGHNGTQAGTQAHLRPLEDPFEAHRAREAVQAKIAKLHMLIAEPTNFLSELALQNQMLACLHWLGEFQILAFIPHTGSLPIRDIAELAAVPEPDLHRIVRMMASVGFLHEPKVGHVEHTDLSAPFGNRPSYHDALRFLTNVAGPAAMQMVPLTQSIRGQLLPHRCSSNEMSLDGPPEARTASGRQWISYLRYVLEDQDSGLESFLYSFDWAGLGKSTVVDIGARSTAAASALVESYPLLNVVIQMNTPFESTEGVTSPRVSVQHRAIGVTQTIPDAAVYVLRLQFEFPSALGQTRLERLRAELGAHLGVLKDNSAARIILVVPVLPQPDESDGAEQGEIAAVKRRVFDMSLLQLANDREMGVANLREMVLSLGDSDGHLVLEGQLQTINRASKDRAFEVRYHRGMHQPRGSL